MTEDTAIHTLPTRGWISIGSATLRRLNAWLVTTLVLMMVGHAGAEPSHPEGTRNPIARQLDNAGQPPALVCRGEMICGIHLLPAAYRLNNYQPLWIEDPSRVDKAEALIDLIRSAGTDGLDPQDYHLDAAVGLLAALRHEAATQGLSIASDGWTDLDLILTDMFLLYGAHLAAGRVNPETLHPDWKIDSHAVDLLKALDHAVATGDVAHALATLRPSHKAYHALREALIGLRTQAADGGWPVWDGPVPLRPRDQDDAVVTLRRRLMASGDLDAAPPADNPRRFDNRLAWAVRRFQGRHGLHRDGIVGPRTRDALNVSIDQRIHQVVINLERWRWLPRDLGDRFVMVNTADFTLRAVDHDREALQLRVVVGSPARRSPVFSADMSYMVANPYWNVPTTIAVEDILPEAQKNPAYLTSRGFRVFETWAADAAEVDPGSIDWHAYHADRFPFRLRQDPGPDNALGRIKFMFPNPFAVYLHDTPHRSLFNRVQRDFSSGCIRVESPVALAAFVLHGDRQWSVEALEAILATTATRVIRLSQPIPVHLLYMTAWVDAAGNLQFRQDIYDRDRDLSRALHHRRPEATAVISRGR